MQKVSTGIAGLDNILKGGYPKERPTLLKGGPGCGKTVFCLFFAYSNILNNRHVTYLTCDEPPELILKNMDQYGLSGSDANKNKKLAVLDFRPNLTDTVTGGFELDAILMRIQSSLSGEDPVVIIDSLQNLLISLGTPNYQIDLLSIFTWCKEHRVTLLVTAASGLITEKDNYFEEYAADCVILLEQLMCKKLMTRILRVLKMRNSAHGTNQYPFLLTETGVSILPITDTSLTEQENLSYISTGIPVLDKMFGGQGYLESSSIMISGSSGTAKSILAATLAASAAKQQKRVLYVSFEESPINFISNVKSAGINLNEPVTNNMVSIHSLRTIEMGLEEHLITIITIIDEIKPRVLILDPITSFLDVGSSFEVKSILIRLISYAKLKNITFIFNQFVHEYLGYQDLIPASSLVDSWIKLGLIESNGEFNRTLQIVKSRGMATSNQMKEFHVTDNGIVIEDPYFGEGDMIFGSRKKEKQAIDKKKKELLAIQLESINKQIDLIEKADQKDNPLENIERSIILFNLLEKKQKIEMQLTESINFVNKKWRK
ncbi:DNA integration/recombination/inversion protein [Legionella sainthelensi]|uniref:non-specific serine/threonine protein kinase n=1 Tax=Legionella sainthelensi TaxID=28087 RepID=A0A0W0YMN5_9GAMM|nr:circadian clock protein KaiC [Legionella sainthelensi]KTD58117.1 DNA integration/recombination/inversion protein [Legionella sainthelensi]VEH33920.1 DNA integration/recombination/inversion protein [Legionella sainthelensi]